MSGTLTGPGRPRAGGRRQAPLAAPDSDARDVRLPQSANAARGWALAWPRMLFGLNAPIGCFSRSALSGCEPGVASPDAGVWPCPPPYGWGQGNPPREHRRRRAWRRRTEVRLVTNCVVLALSHLSVDCSRRCPPRARSGRGLSVRQHAMVARLLPLIHTMLDPCVSEPGRSHRIGLINATASDVSRAEIGDVLDSRTLLKPDRIVNSRSPFMKTSSNFNPVDFLSVFHAAAYVEPSLLERSRLSGDVPSSSVAPPQRSCSSELVDYLRRWDDAGRLLLVETGGVAPGDCGGLFPVPKDEHTDRIVFNRVPRNAREVHLNGYAKFTVSGHDLVDLEVPEGSSVRIWSEDISDFFPAFVASPARGRTNALSTTAPLSAFEGTRAHSDFVNRCRRLNRPLPKRVRPCNQGLVMGDLNAADFAAEAHMKLLRQSGSLDPAHTILNGRPFPRGGHLEMLVIDDHVGIAVEPPSSHSVASSVAASFSAGSRAYAKHGLVTSDRKRRSGVSEGVVLGAEFVRGSPWIGSERSRRLGLARASLCLALSRRCTPALGAQVVGSWVHCLLYRRPLMSVLSALCSWFAAVRTSPPDEVRHLSSKEANELALLAFLSPVMATNMNAGWHPDVFSTDASPFGAGAVSTPVPARIQRELWRHREKRGTYTRVFTEWATRLRLHDFGETADELSSDLFGSSPSPERVLIETFDFLELACGLNAPLTTSVARSGLRVGPRIDLLHDRMWNLGLLRVVEWILFLITRRRVFCVHSGVPCSDMSVAKNPKVRSADSPWGLDPADPDRTLPNFLLGVALSCLLAASRCGVAMSHEHPASAFSWKVPFWNWFVSRPGSRIGRFAACAFGAPYKKDTRLATCHAPWLSVLDRPCSHSEPHAEVLEGSRTRAAAEYLPEFCDAYSAALKAAHVSCDPKLGEPEAASFGDSRRGIFEMLWLNDFVRGAPWRVITSRPEHDSAHINVKELRTLLGEVTKAGEELPSSHVLGISDSRVSIGAAGKGRSASRLLNGEIRRKVPDVVGNDTYPGFLFNPTRLTPSDDPSRLRPLRPAGPVRRPPWWDSLVRGDYSEFDYWASLPKQSFRVSEWDRLVVTILWAHGVRLAPKDSGWDPTLGYPGEGPRKVSVPPNAHLIDLRSFRNLTPAVASRRERLRCEFATFVQVRLGVSLGTFLEYGAADIDTLVSDFGQYLFRSNRARGDFSETINALVDVRRGLKGALPRSWDVSFVWRSLLPAGNRVAMPEKVFLALVSLALVWGWHDMVLMLGIGFMGMLRPHELRALRVADLLTPRRLLSDFPSMYIVIATPKMRRLTARRSYTRVDEPGFIAYADSLCALLPDEAFLFPGSYAQLRLLFNHLCLALGVPTGAPNGLTLGSLRPGGATWLYRLTDDSEKVRFRGRWASQRMLEIYIQEIGAASLVPRLAAPTRQTLSALAGAAPGLLAAAAEAFALAAARPSA